jgi:hypothetical protein
VTLPALKGIRRYLLAARESVEPAAAGVLADLLSDESACDDFRSFARFHLLAPTVYFALDRYMPLPPPGAHLREMLGKDFEHHRALHRRLQSCLDELGVHMSSHGIEFVLMKGPVYAQELYGHLDARHYGDLDILVRASDAIGAMRVMTEMGFNARVHPFLPQRITRAVEHGFAMTLDTLSVDLHHALRIRPAYRIDAERLWGSVRQVRVGSSNILALSEEYEVVSAMLGVAHDLERSSCRAKILIDLYLLLLRAAHRTDWEHFFEMRRKENLLSISVNVLAVMMLVLGSPDTLGDLEGQVWRHADRLAISDLAGALALVEGRPGTSLNRRWFAQIYPGRRYVYRLWLMAAFFASSEFPSNLKKRVAGGR